MNCKQCALQYRVITTTKGDRKIWWQYYYCEGNFGRSVPQNGQLHDV